MLIFIVSFILFTFINTFFHNIQISILSFDIVFILFLIFLIVRYRNDFLNKPKLLWIILLSFILSISAIVYKDYRYDHQLAVNFFNPQVISQTLEMTWQLSHYIWSGQILDTNANGKYILQNPDWDKYIINTSNKYQIWDKLRLAWYINRVSMIQNKWFSGMWNREFDYDRRLIMKWYMWNIYENNSVLLDTKQSDSLWLISNIKKSLQSKIVDAYGESKNAWLILGMLIWDKSQISKSDYQNFIDSGLVHIIAVSWGNIIMIVVFLSFVLWFLPFYLRNLVILIAIVLYSLVCGLDSSVLRAVIFGGLGILALFVGREMNFWRSVWLVFIVMLLINPYFLLYDLWFLLSFGAVIWLKIFNQNPINVSKSDLNNQSQSQNQAISKSNIIYNVCIAIVQRTKNILIYIYKNYIKPSVGANIGILPIIIFFMWKINLIWFVSNLFVLPIVPFVMIYGFVSIYLYKIFPWDGWIWISNLLSNYIYKVSEIWASYGIYLSVDDYIIKYLILILFVLWLIKYLVKNKIIVGSDKNQKSHSNRSSRSIQSI